MMCYSIALRLVVTVAGSVTVEDGACVSGHRLLQRTSVVESSQVMGCGMGTAGTCETNTDRVYQLANLVPGDGDVFFDTFVKVWMDVTPLQGYIFCIGDRPGSWIVGDEYGTSSQLYDSYQGLTYLRNLFISPDDAEDWGTVGYYTSLFCPAATTADQYTELKVAFAFNKCGTTKVNFMLSISPDTFECFVEKLAPVLSRAVGFLPEFTFGVSLDKKFSKTVRLAHGDGDDIRVQDITMAGQLGLSATLRISVGQVLGCDDTLGDILAGDLQAQALLAYDGDLETPLKAIASASVTETLPDLLAGFASAMRVGPAMAATILRQAGANGDVVELIEEMQRSTFMYVLNGYVTLELSGPTTGILPDLSFQLFSTSMMLRTGPASTRTIQKTVWVKGGNGQVCNAVCASRGYGGCDKTQMAGLTTNEKVAEAFLSAGYTCRSFHAARNYAGTPFSKATASDDCAPVIPGTAASIINCDTNAFVHHAPLCACPMEEEHVDDSLATSHLPGLYFYLSADMGDFVESIVEKTLGQVGGLLDVVGVDVDAGISLSAQMGIGFFLNTAAVGFDAEAIIGGSATSIKCIFKFSNQRLRCKARLGWAELFLSAGKFVLNKIDDFAGNGAQEIAEFYSDQVGGTGMKFAKSVVNKGKKVVNKVKCKLSNMLGGTCGRSGGTPSSCGDGTEYVIRDEQDKCLQASPDCYEPDDDGKVYFYRGTCIPAFRDCTHTSSSYSEQMKQYWWYTKDRKLCNEFLHNMYIADIDDPDNNPKCLQLHDQHMYFTTEESESAASVGISKTDTERFKIFLHDVTGPYGQVCFQSSGAGETLDQGRRRLAQKVFVRGYDGGRRRRRCSKDGAKKWRIYQKLEPGNGANYDKENGDAQFNNGCS
ncbi:unnamed protein product [Symbiodinium necroappetens]|uniref:Uncharacterized protein n=1 Tax=Symbiodinium necroappetens TaxID=1628268 RepID=A0A812T2U2_9DINO|nr:unnamed protein product [Symbiodinium necroappetens]